MYHFLPMTVYIQELHAWVREITSPRMTDQTIVVHLKWIFIDTRQNSGKRRWNICDGEMIKSGGFSRRHTTFIFNENKPDDTDLAELMYKLITNESF